MFSRCCVVFSLVTPLMAQTVELSGRARKHGFGTVYRPYRAKDLGRLTANSNRLESLLRAGTLYLSLQDAIALALENNLDIELQRYGPQIADANSCSAEAGGLAARRSTVGAGGPAAPAPTQRGQDTGITTSASRPASSTLGVGGSCHQSRPARTIPNLDPALTGFLQLGPPHQSAKQHLRDRDQHADQSQ